MKKQILTLIIGILIGAIITTGVFLIIKGNTNEQENRMNRGDMPSMEGGFPGEENGGSKPNKENKQNATESTNSVDKNLNSVNE